MSGKKDGDLDLTPDDVETAAWLERTLPLIFRRLMNPVDLNLPILQLPLAQLRLANALAGYDDNDEMWRLGETMGRLSEKLGVRNNALTQAADRLQRQGLIERCGDPNDRRLVRIKLSAKGREWVMERRVRRCAHLEQILSSMNSEERVNFLKSVEALEVTCTRIHKPMEGATHDGSS